MKPSPKKKSDFRVTIRGCRGSYPVNGKQYLKYGGSTTCYEITAGKCTIIIDAGTGIINLGQDMVKKYFASGKDLESRTPIEAIILFSHTHIDHIQGFPFFAPMFFGDSSLYIYGPDSHIKRFEESLNYVSNPPLFPITIDEMNALKLFRTISPMETIYWSDEKGVPIVLNTFREIERIKEIDEKYPVKITLMHNYGHPNNGVMVYKVTYNGKSVVVATDVEGFVGGDQRLIQFCKGADFLLHDAGYTKETYTSGTKSTQGYGHSTPEMAIEVAKKARVKKLALIHHEPAHTDTIVDELEKAAKKKFKNVCCAYEGQVFDNF